MTTVNFRGEPAAVSYFYDLNVRAAIGQYRQVGSCQSTRLSWAAHVNRTLRFCDTGVVAKICVVQLKDEKAIL